MQNCDMSAVSMIRWRQVCNKGIRAQMYLKVHEQSTISCCSRKDALMFHIKLLHLQCQIYHSWPTSIGDPLQGGSF